MVNVSEIAPDVYRISVFVKDFNLQFGGDSRIDKFVAYVDKNPDTNIDVALDSLGYEKNFSNRFLYTRAKTVHSFTKSEETREQYFNQLLSYGSIALFLNELITPPLIIVGSKPASNKILPTKDVVVVFP